MPTHKNRTVQWPAGAQWNRIEVEGRTKETRKGRQELYRNFPFVFDIPFPPFEALFAFHSSNPFSTQSNLYFGIALN